MVLQSILVHPDTKTKYPELDEMAEFHMPLLGQEE